MGEDRVKAMLAAIREELVRRAHETADAIERMVLEAKPARARRHVPAPANDEGLPDELARARARRILKQNGLG